MKPLNIKKIKAIIKAFESAAFIELPGDERNWTVGWSMETKGMERFDIVLLLHDEYNDNDCLNFSMFDISNSVVSKNIITLLDSDDEKYTFRLWKRSPLNFSVLTK